MKIDIDKYKGNCLYTEKDAKGYSYLRRFLPEQYKAYSINGMYRGNYSCSSNAYGDKRMYGMRFELLMEGRSCGTCKARSGKIKFSLPNSEHRYVEVRIYLPLMMIVGIKDFMIEGEVKEPEKREVILCLGDSITQGLDSFLPSRGYVAQIAEKLKVDAVCQGMAPTTGSLLLQKLSLKKIFAAISKNCMIYLVIFQSFLLHQCGEQMKNMTVQQVLCLI